MTTQKTDIIRVCASCELVFVKWHKACPKCGFAHYGAIWAIGFWQTMHRLILRKKRVGGFELKKDVTSGKYKFPVTLIKKEE